MSWSIGLNLGEAFAEVVAVNQNQKLKERWFLPKKPLNTNLINFIKSNKIESVDKCLVTTKLARLLLQRRIGVPPAFLTTRGFENWLEMCLPLEKMSYTTHPKRLKSPLNRDLIFGITERTKANGEIETDLDLSELEFIVAKLQMSGVEHVALGFLHANKNSTNEKKAAEYLQNQGLKVFTSYNYTDIADERARWWRAILEAYISPTFQEYFEELKQQVLNETGVELNIEIIGQEGLLNNQGHNEFLTSVHSQPQTLLKGLQKKNIKEKFVLYCGLEDFLLIPTKNENNSFWTSPFGKIALAGPQYERLKMQPTQGIAKNFWGCSGFTHQEIGYEPGPMSLGRGLHPCLVDLLFASESLDQVNGFTNLLNSKSKKRVHENLMTFSKEAYQTERFTENDIVKWLKETAQENWYMDLFNLTNNSSVLLYGPLADTMFPLLKDFNLKIKVYKGEENLIADFTCQQSFSDASEPQP